MTVCADVGGSFIDLALVDAATVLERRRWPTPVDDWDAFVEVFAGFLRELGPAAADIPVSIALAGLCAGREGAVISANIACIDGRALGSELAAALGRPVTITNDADCFVLAEARLGAAQGHDNVFGLVLGTGVGGGLMLGGKLLAGRSGVTGEWGHGAIVTRPRGDGGATPWFQCGCGQWGCMDTIGAARGLERLHRFLHGEDRASRQITATWLAGEAGARETIDLYLELVSGPLAMLLNTVPVTAVPVGGGLSSCLPLVAALDAAVRARLLSPPSTPLLVPTILGGDAGLLGAALAAPAACTIA